MGEEDLLSILENYKKNLIVNNELTCLSKENIITELDKLIEKILQDKKVDEEQNGGGRKKPTKPKGKHDDMKMKDIKELCKANQIKLSKVVEGKHVVFKKKELITKLKRKKLL
jgi:hypothetical protein